jgi:hypothetical protein
LSRAPVKLELENPAQAFIKPGSQPLTLSVVWKRDAGDAAHLYSEMSKIQANPASSNVGFIEVKTIETDGSIKSVRYPISAYEIGEIADAKFAACRNIDPMTDSNCSSTQGSESDW